MEIWEIYESEMTMLNSIEIFIADRVLKENKRIWIVPENCSSIGFLPSA
jgi:hypothetical protein